jgi:hypothetical protein
MKVYAARMGSGLKIKDVAAASGFTAATLRYYEQIGELMTFASELQAAAAALERHRPQGACDDECGCVSGGPDDATFRAVALSAKPAPDALPTVTSMFGTPS